MPSLADAVLLIHAAFVLFVVSGALYVWVGAWRDWPGIRNPLFRYAHLGAMLFVAAEALLGIVCPLTRWEDALRDASQSKGFVARWVGRLLYYDLPEWVFTSIYLAFATALVLTLLIVPPKRIGRSREVKPGAG